ncbi:ImmA/IrrE family metallo-endopeptidase [Pseudofrankia sp. BMG5.37]|uniref:ImmA/IrrE family metallo-endopeptidase n=1 Tax=Pseudofrankia sp. BMG5.37 TaxID=3050035 RepID=UPI0028953882|nr:ImmA/IrrE family metallo-endopeptidase [Pseudofrankia sp. BMG5.37]MDT3438732.1 ImmA/IrrE family metallo-endopeptidase [Pseudofrankia sp. BMG5.37]
MTKAHEEASRLLRTARLAQPPVPVERLAREAGALISYQPFEADDISGLLYRAVGAAPVIGVNSTNSKVRQRFTIAHELGHLLLHKGNGLIFERHVRLNFRDATSSTATDSEEIDANEFAAELLMPEDLLKKALDAILAGRHLSDSELVARLARRFEVSQQAMTFRLATLGILTIA